MQRETSFGLAVDGHVHVLKWLGVIGKQVMFKRGWARKSTRVPSIDPLVGRKGQASIPTIGPCSKEWTRRLGHHVEKFCLTCGNDSRTHNKQRLLVLNGQEEVTVARSKPEGERQRERSPLVPPCMILRPAGTPRCSSSSGLVYPQLVMVEGRDCDVVCAFPRRRPPP